jgi:hypothetical protein
MLSLVHKTSLTPNTWLIFAAGLAKARVIGERISPWSLI